MYKNGGNKSPVKATNHAGNAMNSTDYGKFNISQKTKTEDKIGHSHSGAAEITSHEHDISARNVLIVQD